jgi:hypothetical protein
LDNTKIDSLKAKISTIKKTLLKEETASIWTRFWDFVWYLCEFLNSDGVKKTAG